MRKSLLAVLAAVGLLAAALMLPYAVGQQAPAAGGPNMALVATASSSYVSGDQTLAAMNSGFDPRRSSDHSQGAFGNWPRTGTQWVQYDWTNSIRTGRIDLYWYADGQGLRAPGAYRVQYWDGTRFVPVTNAAGLGVLLNAYNTTTFDVVTTTRLRVEFDSSTTYSVGILQWKVYDAGGSSAFPPKVTAGIDRVVVGAGRTFLSGQARSLGGSRTILAWSKQTGPGDVTFADAASAVTTATFSTPGDYVLKLTATIPQAAPATMPGAAAAVSGSDTLHVKVEAPPPALALEPVYTRSYTIDNPLWNDRAKALIVGWIPHIVAELSDLNLREGGINNFIQAGNRLAGRPFTGHVGYQFANAYVYNTLEAMCVATQVDPGSDADIKKAQDAMKAKINEWIPIILAAQEPDGYIQTRFTLDPRNAPHWTLVGEHEGYTAGYFLEASIADYIMTNGSDRRMYDAAKRLADCWYDHIGPAPKKSWYDGHEEMEQALVRFSRLVNEVDGPGKGDKYVELSKFLLDCRRGGTDYDQTQLPVIQQYRAAGHAVRAAYLYTGMADIAQATRDPDYQSAVKSIWDDLVNRNLYVTGGIGSGDTSEGFGPDYSLRNNSYCESCSGCAELFFQYNMGLTYHDARYADLYEQTIYNAILGDIDMDGTHFTYTNALDDTGLRTTWHTCPCCVGNIPRTLLQLPTWMYSKGPSDLYVNLFVGSTVNVDNVAGTDVRMVQKTDYPWSGNVAITVNPKKSTHMSVHIRVPNRDPSTLYRSLPDANGIASIRLNGEVIQPAIEQGYAVITRDWSAGDKVELVLPMNVQRVKAVDQVAADAGRVALRYGPLVYSIENTDQDINQSLARTSPLTAGFRGDLLHGVEVITGQFANGTPMLAIPNYARNNRGRRPRSIVWMREQ